MPRRKLPSLLSDRQIRRKVANEKAIFYKEVEDRILSYRNTKVELNIQKPKANENCQIVESNNRAEKQRRGDKDINFDCILNYLCTNKVDNDEAATLEDFKIQSTVEQLPESNSNEDNINILGNENKGDVYDFFDIVQQLQYEDDDDESKETDEDGEDDANYLDTVMMMDEKDPKIIFINDIRSLCIKYIHTIPHTFINDLLAKLKKETGYPFPKDARTFIKTPRESVIHPMADGSYCHYGVENALLVFLKAYKKEGIVTDCIKLIAHVDGALLAKSSENGFWILSVSENVLNLVEVAGIYDGKKKPSDSDELLCMFVDEITRLINNGIMFEGKKYEVKLHAFIGDAPAKAYALKLKYHSGYYSCTKCTIEGVYDKKVFFPTRIQAGTQLRTDEDFRNQKYEGKSKGFDQFQQGETILKRIPNFRPILDVPLDYMHLICLGIILKLIELWIDNPKVVLSEYERKQISEKLLHLREFMPSDFSRNPRQLKNVRRLWKAHELRAFLLYTGPVVLYKILPPTHYSNFLYLHVATSILVNPNLCNSEEWLTYAESLLILFVNTYEKLYGEWNMVFNVHNVQLIVNDVRRFGPLDNFSAFIFENHIRKIKQLLRKGHHKLQQIGNRLFEIRASKDYYVEDETSETNFSIQPKLQEFEVIKNKRFKIDCRSEKDKYVLLDNGTYLDCQCFIKNNEEQILVVGYLLESIGHFYEHPLSSKSLSIQVIKSTRQPKLQTFLYNKILAKICKFPLLKNFVAIPLIHTYSKT